MPTPSSSFDSIASLPPRVVAIRNAIFQTPDDTGLSVSVPTTYALYTGSIAPASDVGENGDWYFYAASGTLRTYRKVIGVWTLVSTITGGGGGGGGDIDGGTVANATITNSTFSGGAISSTTISGSTINTSTLASPAITSPSVTGGAFVGPVITGGTITGAVITGLPGPTSASDAATKQYVDGLAQGLQVHEAVKAATEANITLSGSAPDETDGVALSLNDRILVKDQTDPVENGIYVVSTLGTGANGTWTRATDADSGNELDSAYVLVQEGDTTGGTSWVVSGTPTIGTDDVVWIRFFAVTAVPASIITGSITAGQIGSVNASTITGPITSSQIGSVNASVIAGTITSSQISSVNATAISGTISSSQIGSVSATSISGSITATQIGSVNAGTINGVIVTNQLADQILNTQRLIASDISVVRRVAVLPGLPNAEYPIGSLALNTTNKTLYQNVSGSWSVVTASSNVVGTLTSTDIASVSAASITGLIIAGQIGSVSASSITGSITSAQIGSVAASTITGSISSSQIGSVNASAITGTISSGQIGSVSAASITGTISSGQIGSVSAGTITGTLSSGQIGSVNATTINVGSLSAINYTNSTGESQVNITGSGMTIGTRMSFIASGSNPRLRVTGYDGSYVELNGQNSPIPALINCVTGSANSILGGGGLGLSGGASLSVESGGTVTILSGATLRGPGGINLFGGDANALSIACGEDGSAGGFGGYIVLQINGRPLKIPFHVMS